MIDKRQNQGAEGEGENDVLFESLHAVVRRSPLPEPPPWFAARTLARLRNERMESWLGWFRPVAFFNRLAERLHFWRLTSGVALCGIALGFGLVGLHVRKDHENERLTFAALELIAQGENLFTDEENTWPGGGF